MGITASIAAGLLAKNELIDKPKAQMDDLMKQQMAAQAKLQQNQAEDEAKSEMITERDRARNRQLTAQAASGGKKSTIYTTPLGTIGNQASGGKTVLGQ